MQNDFAIVFEDLTSFLRSLDVVPVIKSARPATQEDLQRFEQITGASLPSTFAKFFTSFANGYSFSWEAGDDGGLFSMPDIDSLAQMRLDWVSRVAEFADDPRSMDQCIDPQYRDEAFRIWQHMKDWLPFIEEAEGDCFCVSLSAGTVVFDKHDWFDGFGDIAQTNGLIGGATLLEFVQLWSRHSFMPMWFTDSLHPAEQTHLDWISGSSRFVRP